MIPGSIPGGYVPKIITVEDRERVKKFTPTIDEKLDTHYPGFEISSAEVAIVAGTKFRYHLVPGGDFVGAYVIAVIYRDLKGNESLLSAEVRPIYQND